MFDAFCFVRLVEDFQMEMVDFGMRERGSCLGVVAGLE